MKRNSKPARPSPLLVELGREMRALRQQRGLTLRALAQASRLSERFVCELEAGRANISVVNLAELASALGTSLAALFAHADGGEARSRVMALLGLRGAGKSTVGKALAERLAVPFFELDRLVETQAGMGLSEIFAIHGEGYFREVELTALRRFFAEHDVGVLATGGGLVTSPEAMKLLVARAHTVWLKATPEEHWTRVVKQGDLRPMRNRPQAMAELRRRLKEREPLYARAEHVCNTSGRTVNQVVNELQERVTWRTSAAG
ncbi:MAG: shikimate kinase [Myxococcota bacterium]